MYTYSITTKASSGPMRMSRSAFAFLFCQPRRTMLDNRVFGPSGSIPELQLQLQRAPDAAEVTIAYAVTLFGLDIVLQNRGAEEPTGRAGAAGTVGPASHLRRSRWRLDRT